jgi:hypothetical protein
LNKVFVVIGIILLIGGGLLATISVTTTIDDTPSVSENLARKFLFPDVPLHLPVGETVTTRFDVTGTSPQRDIVVGITTETNLDSVLVNSTIIDEAFTAEGAFIYILGTTEVDEGGLITFSWSVDSGAPVLFGVFDTDGYLTVTDILTNEAFQNNALVWGSLSDGIGYLEAPKYDDYFFLLSNINDSDEEVTAEVFMVTIAAIPYLDSASGTTQATFTYDITSEDDYRLVVELPDGAYDITFHSELASQYPYQIYGLILLLIGGVIALAGFIIKEKPQIPQ